MMGKVIRLPDIERKSRHADAIDRDPAESALIIILPVIRIERFNEPYAFNAAVNPRASR